MRYFNAMRTKRIPTGSGRTIEKGLDLDEIDMEKEKKKTKNDGATGKIVSSTRHRLSMASPNDVTLLIRFNSTLKESR
jgi:hypothetical protein